MCGEASAVPDTMVVAAPVEPADDESRAPTRASSREQALAASARSMTNEAAPDIPTICWLIPSLQ
jgi:hypothetical protein